MQHIKLKCKKHPKLRWNCKSIAVNSDGSYNGRRNIFFRGHVERRGVIDECVCSASDLTFANDTERDKWAEDRT